MSGSFSSPASSDHRDLGRDLDLFTAAEPVGPGLPMWLPAGAVVVNELERYIAQVEHRAGYHQVRTPALGKRQLYETSGHWHYFAADLFPSIHLGGNDEDDLVLRPVLCPHHALVYRSRQFSHRDLPLRLAEFGSMYRRERSGVLSGLTRVRAITLNDAHHFCAPAQVPDEIERTLALIDEAYAALGIEADHVRLSLDDGSTKFAGKPAWWRQGEAWLREALDRRGLDYVVAPGEAAFYGPKIDIQVRDAHHREFTLSTVQVDHYQPERFDLSYVDATGDRSRPVMVHRSVLSSLERMMAYLVESYAGALPPWLAPIQVLILPISAVHGSRAQAIADALHAAGLRAEVDARNESLGARIRSARLRKVCYIGIVGADEVASGALSVLTRDGTRLPPAPVDACVATIAEVVAHRRPRAEWN